MSQLPTRVPRKGSRDKAPESRNEEESDVEARLLGERLRQLRISRKLSQIELAEAAGLTQATVSSLEIGKKGMRVKTAVALGRALKVTMDELLGIDDVLLPGDSTLSDDEYPNRRRLRVTPEFIALPAKVQRFIIGIQNRHGDVPFWEWINEAQRALRRYELGELDGANGVLPAKQADDPPKAPKRR